MAPPLLNLWLEVRQQNPLWGFDAVSCLHFLKPLPVLISAFSFHWSVAHGGQVSASKSPIWTPASMLHSQQSSIPVSRGSILLIKHHYSYFLRLQWILWDLIPHQPVVVISTSQCHGSTFPPSFSPLTRYHDPLRNLHSPPALSTSTGHDQCRLEEAWILRLLQLLQQALTPRVSPHDVKKTFLTTAHIPSSFWVPSPSVSWKRTSRCTNDGCEHT